MSDSADCAARLIAGLSSPAAYEHAVDSIEVLETHISWVILTGAFAYKVKKPVSFGFLDFVTLERRRFYCEEEVRLNQRLAPELYCGVVAITGTADKPHVGGAGELLEFAVRMRQFPQEALLGRVFEHGLLSAALLDDLADLIALFHGRIAVAPADSRFGTPEQIRRCIEQNLAQLALAPDDEATIARLEGWCANEFHSREESFLARKRAGFIRECHGDMHLANMLLLDGKPVIFDCIEFNEEFRWIDVLSEVAFAVMDFEHHGSSKFAYHLINSYLERTGDYAGLSVFRYYLVYRALVRAKITGIRARQIGGDTRAADFETVEYRKYLDLAQHYAQRCRPLLVVTHGPSGSGKTTGSRAIQEAIGGVCLRSDVERKRLFGFDRLDRTAAEKTYSPEATARTYARLAELAGYVLDAGFPVIVDATFLKRAQRQEFRQLAHDFDVPFVVLDFPVVPQVLQERIARRLAKGGDASEANLAILGDQLASREPLDDVERSSAIPLDSDRPETLAAALAEIEALRT